MKRAFTVIELLSVTVILAVLASFLFPVLVEAIHSAKVSSQIGKFHQLHTAFSIYRTDYDGDARWGLASEMGLPTYDALEAGTYQRVSPEADLWRSSCGTHPEVSKLPTNIHYVYPPCDYEAGCGEYYRKYQDQSMLLIDVNCIDPSAPFESPFYRKLLVGVRLNGQVSKLITTNNPELVSNWHQDAEGEKK